MNPVYDHDGITLFHGDCVDVLATLDPGSIDAVVTDPPYGMGWDTDCARFSGGSKHHRKAAAGRDWGAPIEGDDRPFDPAPWLSFPKVILWGANHFSARLPVGTTLVWVKREEDAYGSFLSDAEIGWMKGGHGVYLHKDLSMNAVARGRAHPNQKPVGLMEWCVCRVSRPGDTILDPYAGSGTTGIACLNTLRRCILVEREAKYIPVIIDRLQDATLDTYLPKP